MRLSGPAVSSASDAPSAERIAVWIALSELWLDTELDAADLERIALVLAASPFGVNELRWIHEAEVAPVLSRNLRATTGVWAGFDRDWLWRECGAAARRSRTLGARLARLLRQAHVRRHTLAAWRAIEARIATLRPARHP